MFDTDHLLFVFAVTARRRTFDDALVSVAIWVHPVQAILELAWRTTKLHRTLRDQRRTQYSRLTSFTSYLSLCSRLLNQPLANQPNFFGVENDLSVGHARSWKCMSGHWELSSRTDLQVVARPVNTIPSPNGRREPRLSHRVRPGLTGGREALELFWISQVFHDLLNINPRQFTNEPSGRTLLL